MIVEGYSQEPWMVLGLTDLGLGLILKKPNETTETNCHAKKITVDLN